MTTNTTHNKVKIIDNRPVGLSIAALVTGIFNILVGWWCLCFLLPLASLILSMIALVKCNRGLSKGRYLAAVGVMLNLLVVILTTIYFFYIIYVIWFGSEAGANIWLSISMYIYNFFL